MLAVRRGFAVAALVTSTVLATVSGVSAAGPATAHGHRVYLQLGLHHHGRELTRLDPDTLVSEVTPLKRLYVAAQPGRDPFAPPRVLDVFRHDGMVVNRIRLHRNQTWRVIDNRLFVGGLRFGASAAEVDPRTGRSIRTLAKGSKWQSLVTIWTPPAS